MTQGAEGRGISRRRLGSGVLALGGALALGPIPFADAAAAVGGGPSGEDGSPAGGRPTLRRGSPEQAGLIPRHLEQLVTDAETFLGPSPKHPWYAGAVLLAGRGGTVALHRPIGKAVRYAAYDEKTDTGVEFPPERQIPMAEDTVFDLASVSKLFTSLLAVQQIERGTLRLEAAVATYLPDFGAGGSRTSPSASCSPTPRGCAPGSRSTRSPPVRASSGCCGTRSRSRRPAPATSTPISI